VRRTSRLVLLLGIFLAALTFVVVLLISQPGGGGGQTGEVPGASPTAPPNLPTVVAAVDIPLGTVVTADMLTSRTIAQNLREPGVLGDPSIAVGRVTQRSILTGEQVHDGDFQVRSIELEVPPGRRAMAIAVNEMNGVASLVTTGDTVDLVVTLSGAQFPATQVLSDGTVQIVSGINPLTTKLILQDIQIIASMGPYVPPPPPVQGQPAPTAIPGYVTDLPAGSRLLILAVTPAQAEVLVFARSINERNELGNADAPVSHVDVVLRSPDDAGIITETTGVILKTLVDTYGVLPPELVPVPIPSAAP